MLVALPSAIAFGVLVFTTLGPEYAGQGAMAGALGAAALGIINPLIGRTGGLISVPCAPAAAVLSALVVSLLQSQSGKGIEPSGILPLLVLTALLAAGFQILLGAAGAGRLIKFVPYQVVSGYLSGVAVLIALGQLPKLLGLPAGVPLHRGLFSTQLWQWPGIVVGVVTMVVMVAAPRLTRKLPAAMLGLAGGLAAYFIAAVFRQDLLKLQDNSLLIGPIQASGSFLGSWSDRIHFLNHLSPASVQLILIPALTLALLLSIDTLKTCVVLDVLIRRRHNSDRELIGQGLGNLASALMGGMPGAGAMGPTLVNVSSGGRSPRSGMFEGALVLVALLALNPLIAWIPIGALAAILLVVAWRTFDRSIFRLLWTPAGRLDFAVIAGVILVAATVDLIAAAGVGVVLAILLFIRDQIRSTVIRHKRYLNQVFSKTLRLPKEHKLLRKYGDQAVFCELQGNLFFGTIDQLASQMQSDLQTRRYILFDLRRVHSMDYTAVHLFEQMQAQLAERGGKLLFSGMPSGIFNQQDFEKYLAGLGVLRNDGGIMVSETLDGALEWMEDRILESAGVPRKEEQLLEVKDMELFEGMDEQTLGALNGRLREISIAQGQRLFEVGDPGDELYLVRRGSIRILLPLEGGKLHHLATIAPGTFLGEICFLETGRRTAIAEAKARTDLYVLPRGEFEIQCASDPIFSALVYRRMAQVIGSRLRKTDSELRALEDR